MDLLHKIKNFKGLEGLSYPELNKLTDEIRKKIVNTITRNGGHLASSLGAVELTVAALRVFNPDEDVFLFDVGHQSYAYKILTDRLDKFDTIRKKDGISGFPRINESKYDFFSTGHSSTSISAALGYAKARDLSGKDNNVIAVIGDGSLLNGVAFEALNSVATTKTKIIVILNDNRMSINKRTGGMAEHLARLSTSNSYIKFKHYVKTGCNKIKYGKRFETVLNNMKSKIKYIFLPTNVFEEIGLHYWGPFDGHNIEQIERILQLAKKQQDSVIIHLVTKKGKGYKPAEDNPVKFHGVSPVKKTEASTSCNTVLKPWSEAVAETIEEIAVIDPKIYACTAAMKDGTKLSAFEEKYPDRFIDVGISEEHMLVYAAGLAAGGLKPVVCIYSTFLQRAADQIVHDIALQKLPVLICVDRAGLVGEDGETHHGVFDVNWFKSVPNMTILAPRDIDNMKAAIKEWSVKPRPMIVRYPRGKAMTTIASNSDTKAKDIFKADILRNGKDICFISFGSTINLTLNAAELLSSEKGINATVVDIKALKPIDYETIDTLLSEHKLFVSVEEDPLNGGISEDLLLHLNSKGYKGNFEALALPDKFIPHATHDEQWQDCGFTEENILRICNKYGY